MKIKVGLLGLGTVGSGVYQIIQNHQAQLQQQLGCAVEVSKVLVRDVTKKRQIEIPEGIFTTDVNDILEDKSIDIVVEVIGGVEKSKEFLLRALNNKKHVVTANKDVIAMHSLELLNCARDNGCDLFYEASVAGGIPIIRSLVDGLASDKITKMLGIVNGTTNYILTKMTNEGSSYEAALEKAKDLGFAEADPTADIEGLDAARKMVILATLGFLTNVALDDVYIEGISKVTKEDIDYTKLLGYTIKLIGLASRVDDAVEVSVQPTLIPTHHPLAAVENEFNAVYVYGEAVGETMFYGPGAGGLPTATAVVSDVVAVIKNMRLGVNGESIRNQYNRKLIKTKEQIYSKYFMRLKVKDEVGVFLKIATIFQNNQMSIESILQKPCNDGLGAEIIIISHKVSLRSFDNSLGELKNLEEVIGIQSSYRVEGM
jgi:homoserine dehydrogenase